MMHMRLEKRLRALERRIIVQPVPPFVVWCEAEDGGTELCWINWFDNGVGKSWSRGDGLDLSDELKAQMRQYYPSFSPNVEGLKSAAAPQCRPGAR